MTRQNQGSRNQRFQWSTSRFIRLSVRSCTPCWRNFASSQRSSQIESTKSMKPRERALDHPPRPPQPAAVGPSAFGQLAGGAHAVRVGPDPVASRSPGRLGRAHSHSTDRAQWEFLIECIDHLDKLWR